MEVARHVYLKTLGRLSKRHKILVFFLGTLVFFSSVSLALLLKGEEINKSLLINQVHNQNLILARSGALTIDLFLKNLKFEISTLSQHPKVLSADKTETRRLLEDFIDRYKDSPLVGIGRFDQKGRLVVLANRERVTAGEGESFSDREYTRWSKDPKNKGKAFYTQPFISSAGVTQDQNVIALATPIYLKDQYEGTLALIILIEEFNEKFVDSIRINNKGHSFLMEKDGVVVACDHGLLGQNLFDFAQKTKWDGWENYSSALQRAINQDESKTIWKFQYPGQSPTEEISVIKKIKVDEQEWFLVVSDDISVLDDHLSLMQLKYPISTNKDFLMVLMIAATASVGFFFVLIDYISHHDGIKDGVQRERESK